MDKDNIGHKSQQRKRNNPNQSGDSCPVDIDFINTSGGYFRDQKFSGRFRVHQFLVAMPYGSY
jgi:hypothetical protein